MKVSDSTSKTSTPITSNSSKKWNYHNMEETGEAPIATNKNEVTEVPEKVAPHNEDKKGNGKDDDSRNKKDKDNRKDDSGIADPPKKRVCVPPSIDDKHEIREIELPQDIPAVFHTNRGMAVHRHSMPPTTMRPEKIDLDAHFERQLCRMPPHLSCAEPNKISPEYDLFQNRMIFSNAPMSMPFSPEANDFALPRRHSLANERMMTNAQAGWNSFPTSSFQNQIINQGYNQHQLLQHQLQKKKRNQDPRKKTIKKINAAKAKNKEKTVSLEDNDVICGRGICPRSHPGNCYYLRLITEFCKTEDYESLSDNQKMNVAQSIVKKIHDTNGRFLQRDSNGDDNVWYEISNFKAIDKTNRQIKLIINKEQSSNSNSADDSLGTFHGDSHAVPVLFGEDLSCPAKRASLKRLCSLEPWDIQEALKCIVIPPKPTMQEMETNDNTKETKARKVARLKLKSDPGKSGKEKAAPSASTKGMKRKHGKQPSKVLVQLEKQIKNKSKNDPSTATKEGGNSASTASPKLITPDKPITGGGQLLSRDDKVLDEQEGQEEREDNHKNKSNTLKPVKTEEIEEDGPSPMQIDAKRCKPLKGIKVIKSEQLNTSPTGSRQAAIPHTQAKLYQPSCSPDMSYPKLNLPFMKIGSKRRASCTAVTSSCNMEPLPFERGDDAEMVPLKRARSQSFPGQLDNLQNQESIALHPFCTGIISNHKNKYFLGGDFAQLNETSSNNTTRISPIPFYKSHEHSKQTHIENRELRFRGDSTWRI